MFDAIELTVFIKTCAPADTYVYVKKVKYTNKQYLKFTNLS